MKHLVVMGVACLGLVAQAQAVEETTDHVYFGPELGVSTLAVGDQANQTLVNGTIRVGVPVYKEFLAVEGAWRTYAEWEESGSDVVGRYTTKLDLWDVELGLKMYVTQTESFPLFLRGGLLYSNAELEVHESFYGAIPSGTAKKSDDTLGYYLSFGVDWLHLKHFDLYSSVDYRQRDDFFSDSVKPIDTQDWGVTTGLRIKF